MAIPKIKNDLRDDILQLHNKLYKLGLVEGYEKGYSDGFEDGYDKRTFELKSALSDGLRSGSSDCGTEMQKLKKLK